MQFIIDPIVFQKNPGLLVGALILHGIGNGGSPAELTELLREAERHVRSTLTEETFKAHPSIASFQEAHRRFGNNPNKYPPSHQALVKRVLKGGELPRINPLVDCYNVISLRHILPAGGECLDTVEGNIRLTYAAGGEEFYPLGSAEQEPPDAGELIYRDDRGVICRKFDWREGDRTKLTEETRNAVLVIEALPPTTREEMEKALGELQELVRQFCEAEGRVEVLCDGRTECNM